MSGNYAHYRIGAALLSAFPADSRRSIQRFRRLFDAGLHGPDIFFYHSPLVPTSVGTLGSKYHSQSGREFFMRGCRIARLEKSEAAQAYVYGVLCHYALDSLFQPFIQEQAKIIGATPSEIETEFDRFLLKKDGKIPPESQNISKHLQLTPGECETVAKFYPPVTSRQVQRCLKSMTAHMKLLATPDGTRRKILQKGMQLFGPHVAGMLMTVGPNEKCTQLNPELMKLYKQAMVDFPELLNQVQSHLTYNAVLGEEFTKIFG